MLAAAIYAMVTLRARWRSAVVLALLVWLVGTVVLATFAGARRTTSAFDRFREETHAADLTIFAPAFDKSDLADLRSFPGVEAIGLGKQLTALVNGGFGSVGGPLDRVFGRTLDRSRLLDGRRAREDRINEVVVPEQLALSERIDVGDTVTLHAFTPEQTAALAEGGELTPPAGPNVELHVVGISRAPADLSIEGASGGLIFTTRAFVREYGDRIGSFAPFVLRVRVVDDEAAARFVRAVRARYNTPDSPGLFQVQPTSETEGAIQQSIDVLATGLLVFASIALLTGLVVIAVGSRRFVDEGAIDLPALRALGMSRAQRTVALGLPVMVMGIVGAVVAAIGAVLASPLMPIGLARKAEPNLGLDLDSSVIGLGVVVAAALVTLIGLLAALLADRAQRATSESSRSSLLAVHAFDAGLTPPVAVGVTMALHPGRGSRAMPVRQGIFAVVVAIAGTLVVVMFATSLDRLTSTPAAYGYNWNAHTEFCSQGSGNERGGCAVARHTVADDPAVAAVAEVFTGTMEVEGHPITGAAVDEVRGSIEPTVLEGRAPRHAGEVALGTETLAITGTEVGSVVDVVGDQGGRSYRVVGRVALPVFTGSSDPGDLQAIADGVVLTGAGFDRISGTRSDGSRLVLRWRPGTDPAEAIARLREVTGPISSSPVPLEVERLGQVDELPWALGAFLAAIGILGIAYVTAAGVRRRSCDLAILKTIGFRRAQVGAAVATQASTLGLIGILIGIPLGLVVGRLVWDRVANSVGVASDPTIAVVSVVAIALGALVVVNVTAVLPARPRRTPASGNRLEERVMGAAWMCARADARGRWKSGLALMVLVGLVSAVVLTGAAGARRTSTSFERFLAESRVSDAYVFPGEVTKQQVREFADVPYIEALGAGQTLQVAFPDGSFVNAGALTDTRFGRVLERAQILEGRLANPRAVHEVAVPEPLAEQRHLRVGDRLVMESYTPEQVEAIKSGAFSSFPKPEGPELHLRIVGITRLPSDLSLTGTEGGILFFTPALGKRYEGEIGSYVGAVFGVKLRDGAADVPRLVRRARAFFGDSDSFDVSPLGQSTTGGVQQSIDVLALGAAIFAAVAAIAGLTAVGLVLRRRIDAGSDHAEILRSLGVPRAQRALATGLPAVPIAVGGALFGVLGAWLASPLFPMGLARKAEPDRGMHLDALVLGLGLLAIVTLLLLIVAVIAWRSARVAKAEPGTSRTSVVARASESAGLVPTVSIGLRLALERRASRLGVPVRAALVGTIAAVLGVVGVGVFATSLRHLEQTPGLYGFNWDARVLGGVAKPEVPDRPCTANKSRLTAVRGVSDVSSICSINVVVGGRPMVAFGLTPIRGSIEPTIVEGRAPRTAHEIALGKATLAALGLEIGDQVTATSPNGPVPYRIVGTGAAPQFPDQFADLAPVDDGAFFTGNGLDRLDDPEDTDSNVEALIRIAPGANRDAVLRRVEHLRGVADFEGGPGVATAAFPLELERLRDVDDLPVVLGVFLALLGVITVGFVLASSVRRRRRDLAILKTLGFARRQVSATVAWQATTIAVVGLLVGVPLGIVVGRALWQTVAEDIGVVSTPNAAVGLLVGVVLVTIALANLVAAVPAWAAARTRPAVALRAE